MRFLQALVAASILFVSLAGCQNQRANVQGSRAAAEKWVSDVLPGYKIVGFSSATLDTDDDGYVTAEITVSNGSGKGYMIQLECPTQGKLLELQRGGGAKLRQIPYNNAFEMAPSSKG